MWWETLPAQIATWSAAVAGLLYLARKAWRALRFGKRLTIAVGRLIEIGDTTDWPNGAEGLPQAMNEIYRRQGETHDLVLATKARLEDYIVAHRADHGLMPVTDPIETPDGF